MRDIAICHDVFFAFNAEPTLVAGLRVAAGLKQFVPLDDFGAYEAFFEVGMNDSRSLRRFGAGNNCPSFDLDWACCEESYEIEEFVSGAGQAIESGFRNSKLFH